MHRSHFHTQQYERWTFCPSCPLYLSLTGISHNRRKIPPEESAKKRGDSTRNPECRDDDGVVLRVVYVVVVHRSHHVVRDHLPCRRQ